MYTYTYSKETLIAENALCKEMEFYAKMLNCIQRWFNSNLRDILQKQGGTHRLLHFKFRDQ